jgi:hypothetical protein
VKVATLHISDFVQQNAANTKTNRHHGGPNLKDPLRVPDGPIIRSRAKKIKEAMQGLVQSTWAEFANLSSKTSTFGSLINFNLNVNEVFLHREFSVFSTCY